MKKIVLTLLLIAWANSANSQWKKIGDFIGTDGTVSVGEYITCIYFLDLPGPPRIGFVGTESELHKTTDGGKTWHSVWDSGWTFSGYYVTDICFKDSLTGWFTTFGGVACYRTTDGGKTWSPLLSLDSNYGADAVYYCAATNRLFLAMAGYIETKVSTDLGNTWQTAIPSPNLTYLTTGFSFSSSLNGIAAAGFYPDTISGYLITTDGGITWDSVHSDNDGEPLAIPGTSTCFMANYGWRQIIRRSDDFGHTWRQIADLTGDSSQYCTGIIRGDFSRLTIQTDTGMYVSIDSGVTWNFDGGPTYITNFSNDRFYSSNGITFAGMTYSTGIDEDGGLWEEIWPQAGVADNKSTLSTLSVFPNPATSSITIEYPAGPVAVYDPLGRKCAVTVKENLLDVSELPTGVYFVTDGVSHVRFVKE